jgi:hypothetical protein
VRDCSLVYQSHCGAAGTEAVNRDRSPHVRDGHQQCITTLDDPLRGAVSLSSLDQEGISKLWMLWVLRSDSIDLFPNLAID